MFRIRRLLDDLHPANRAALDEVKRTLAQQFPGVPQKEIDSLREELLNPFPKRFRTMLYVAENARGRVLGFAIVKHDPAANFCLLDFIAVSRGLTSRGIGGALYEHLREEARLLDARGLFFECLPDDPAACSDPKLAAANAARLKFYENWGARPIVGTEYERPIRPGDLDMPHLVYDDLDSDRLPAREFARRVIRAILERKYAELCPREYVEAVVRSVKDDPVRIRPARYLKREVKREPRGPEPLPLLVNLRHEIHHVRDRGYVEAPVRIRAILREIEPTGLFSPMPPREHPRSHILAVHDADFVRYLETVCAGVPDNRAVYPYVFPIRNAARPPKELSMRAGYYCIDTFTPLSANSFAAAKGAVDCALTAAEEIARGRPIAYALVRPPGHHAERRAFGGFCYFNNAAIAAQRLSSLGRVAILDIDYHHGNGQQQIFYPRNDVLTVSIHGHPSFAYPYFSGFADEHGTGDGEGFNFNLPLPAQQNGADYRKALARALRRIESFRPDFLVVAFGVDTARGDPTGSWTLGASDFDANGRMIAELGLPTLVVQEGGYRTRTLGGNVRSFFQGLTSHGQKAPAPRPARVQDLRAPAARRDAIDAQSKAGIALRRRANESDVAAIRAITTATGFFYPAEVDIAIELIEDRLAKGEDSDYDFLFADDAATGATLGYACYGPIPLTQSSWDLYWIAVSPQAQRRGIGHALMKTVEQDVRARGGKRLYVDTASRPAYQPTRAFYRDSGYKVEAQFPDFYAPGDAKVVMVKVL